LSQPPQWLAFVVRSTHAPLQSVRLPLQVTSQAPWVQAAAPFAGGEHVMEHAPQLFVSVVRSTHAPLQSVWPALQVTPQLPCAQVAVAWAGAVHEVPHAPQCVGSDEVSTQALPQRVFAQVLVHAGGDPDVVEHTMPAAQLAAQAPQCVASFSAVSHPSDGSPLQSSKPAAQDACGTTHCPPLQLVGPLTLASAVQSLLHAPHKCRSLADVQVPASPQAISPLGQVQAPHWHEASHVCEPPPAHAWVAPAEQIPSPPQALHADQLPFIHVRACIPHLPQLCVEGPEHEVMMGPVGGGGCGAGVAAEDHEPQGGMPAPSVLQALLTTRVAPWAFALEQAPGGS